MTAGIGVLITIPVCSDLAPHMLVKYIAVNIWFLIIVFKEWCLLCLTDGHLSHVTNMFVVH